VIGGPVQLRSCRGVPKLDAGRRLSGSGLRAREWSRSSTIKVVGRKVLTYLATPDYIDEQPQNPMAGTRTFVSLQVAGNTGLPPEYITLPNTSRSVEADRRSQTRHGTTKQRAPRSKVSDGDHYVLLFPAGRTSFHIEPRFPQRLSMAPITSGDRRLRHFFCRSTSRRAASWSI